MNKFKYKNFEEIFHFPKGHAELIKRSYFFRDSVEDNSGDLYLVTCSEDNSIELWDIQNHRLLRRIHPAHNDLLSSSDVFMPINKFRNLKKLIVVTTGGIEDCSIKIWDLWAQKLKIKIRNAHKDIIKKLEFIKQTSHEQDYPSYLVTLSYDATFKVWDIAKSQQLITVRLDMIGETFFFFKSINFGHRKGTWNIGILDFQSPRIQVYDILSRKKMDEITGFYSCPNYDRDITITWWRIGNITYLAMAHRYGCIIWNYEGSYKVYEINNLKALFQGKILALDKLIIQNKLHILFSNDKVIYVIKFEVLGHLLRFMKIKKVQGENIVTGLEQFVEPTNTGSKIHLLKSLNALSYNNLSILYQNCTQKVV